MPVSCVSPGCRAGMLGGGVVLCLRLSPPQSLSRRAAGSPHPVLAAFSLQPLGSASPRDKGKREQPPLLLLDSIPSTTSAPSAEWDGVGRESFAKRFSPIPTPLAGAGGGMLHGPPGASPSSGFGAVPHPRAEAGGHIPQPLCLGWITASVHLGNRTRGSPPYPKTHLLPTRQEKQEEERDAGCKTWP